jgi:hypothetical protein
MGTFKDYYDELLKWENEQDRELVATWDASIQESIKRDFSSAVNLSNLKQLEVPIRPGSTPQSMGNQFADFFVQTINPSLREFRIQKCSGAGYPDKQLRCVGNSRSFPLELKATPNWNPADSNRVVLTCSSDKLKKYFSPPISHLLVTLCFEESDDSFSIASVKLDFLEPDTEVNVRLEASVSQRILHNGRHHKHTI